MSNHSDDDDLRLRVNPPKQRGQSFVSQVIRQASKAGGLRVRRAISPPGARLGRGHVVARLLTGTQTPGARRVTIKARLVNLRKAGMRSTLSHLRYIEREGVGRQGETGQAYGPTTDQADLKEFESRGRDDRHQFRFIVSAEDAEELDDLRAYTRQLMTRMEADLGTMLDWVAVDHWNTDNPHTHIVVRGKDDTGRDLVIARDYIAGGMRMRASELATEWLGPRTELEIQNSLRREVEQRRWTSLDKSLQRELNEGSLRLERLARHPNRQLLIGRLQNLQHMGLAHEGRTGEWTVHADAQATLRSLGERGDIIRTMQRAMDGLPRELVVFDERNNAPPVLGRIVARGFADEFHDRGYLVVDGVDGKAHYLPLPKRADLSQYPIDAIVEARSVHDPRSVDRDIAARAVNGIYCRDHHATSGPHAPGSNHPEAAVERHVRRLEALRRAGIVERVSDGAWRVPNDLPERGRQFDLRRLGEARVEIRSSLPIERQSRALGATWLDQRLIAGGKELSGNGFGAEVREALRQRADFLVERGLAERQGHRLVLARNLLTTLRDQELALAAREVATLNGLHYRPAVEGTAVSGVYRRDLQLVSGRFAVLEDGIGFSLVPWKPVIEQRLGQHLSAVLRGNQVSWQIGRQRGPAIG